MSKAAGLVSTRKGEDKVVVALAYVTGIVLFCIAVRKFAPVHEEPGAERKR